MTTSKKGNALGGCLTFIFAFVVIGFLVHGCSKSPSGSNSNQQTAQTEPATPKLSSDELMNAKTLDEKYESDADVYCGSGADDYLRSVAKYDFKWDNVGMLDPKFDHYLQRVSAPGVLTLVTQKAMLQNGFGAFARTTLTCDYDTQSKTVLGYHIITDE